MAVINLVKNVDDIIRLKNSKSEPEEKLEQFGQFLNSGIPSGLVCIFSEIIVDSFRNDEIYLAKVVHSCCEVLENLNIDKSNSISIALCILEKMSSCNSILKVNADAISTALLQIFKRRKMFRSHVIKCFECNADVLISDRCLASLLNCTLQSMRSSNYQEIYNACELSIRLLDYTDSNDIIYKQCRVAYNAILQFQSTDNQLAGQLIGRLIAAGIIRIHVIRKVKEVDSNMLFKSIEELTKPPLAIKRIMPKQTLNSTDNIGKVIIQCVKRLDKHWLELHMKPFFINTLDLLCQDEDICLSTFIAFTDSWLGEKNLISAAKYLVEILAATSVTTHTTDDSPIAHNNHNQINVILRLLHRIILDIDSAIKVITDDDSLGLVHWISLACMNKIQRYSAMQCLLAISNSLPDKGYSYFRTNFDMLQSSSSISSQTCMDNVRYTFSCIALASSDRSPLHITEELFNFAIGWLTDNADQLARVSASLNIISNLSKYRCIPNSALFRQLNNNAKFEMERCAESAVILIFQRLFKKSWINSDQISINAVCVMCFQAYIHYVNFTENDIISSMAVDNIRISIEHLTSMNRHNSKQSQDDNMKKVRLRFRIYQLVGTLTQSIVRTFLSDLIPILTKQLTLDLLVCQSTNPKHYFTHYFMKKILPDVTCCTRLPFQIEFDQNTCLYNDPEFIYITSSLLTSMFKVMSSKQIQQTLHHFKEIVCQTEPPVRDLYILIKTINSAIKTSISSDFLISNKQSFNNILQLLIHCIESIRIDDNLCFLACKSLGRLCKDIVNRDDIITILSDITSRMNDKAKTLIIGRLYVAIGFIYQYNGSSILFKENLYKMLILLDEVRSAESFQSLKHIICALILMLESNGALSLTSAQQSELILLKCIDILQRLNPAQIQNNDSYPVSFIVARLLTAVNFVNFEGLFDLIQICIHILWQYRDDIYTRICIYYWVQCCFVLGISIADFEMQHVLNEIIDDVSCENVIISQFCLSCIRQICQKNTDQFIFIWNIHFKNETFEFEEWIFKLLEDKVDVYQLQFIKDIIIYLITSTQNRHQVWINVLTKIVSSGSIGSSSIESESNLIAKEDSQLTCEFSCDSNKPFFTSSWTSRQFALESLKLLLERNQSFAFSHVEEFIRSALLAAASSFSQLQKSSFEFISNTIDLYIFDNISEKLIQFEAQVCTCLGFILNDTNLLQYQLCELVESALFLCVKWLTVSNKRFAKMEEMFLNSFVILSGNGADESSHIYKITLCAWAKFYSCHDATQLLTSDQGAYLKNKWIAYLAIDALSESMPSISTNCNCMALRRNELSCQFCKAICISFFNTLNRKELNSVLSVCFGKLVTGEQPLTEVIDCLAIAITLQTQYLGYLVVLFARSVLANRSTLPIIVRILAALGRQNFTWTETISRTFAIIQFVLNHIKSADDVNAIQDGLHVIMNNKSLLKAARSDILRCLVQWFNTISKFNRNDYTNQLIDNVVNTILHILSTFNDGNDQTQIINILSALQDIDLRIEVITQIILREDVCTWDQFDSRLTQDQKLYCLGSLFWSIRKKEDVSIMHNCLSAVVLKYPIPEVQRFIYTLALEYGHVELISIVLSTIQEEQHKVDLLRYFVRLHPERINEIQDNYIELLSILTNTKDYGIKSDEQRQKVNASTIKLKTRFVDF